MKTTTSEGNALNKGPLVERLHRAELKVMTWNLADFSTGGVVQERLWSKQDGASGSTGRLTFVAETISREAPDVVFIQEVKTGKGGNTAMKDLTDKLNEIMNGQPCGSTVNKTYFRTLLNKSLEGNEEAKSELIQNLVNQNERKREPEVWIKDKARSVRTILSTQRSEVREREEIIARIKWEFDYELSDPLKHIGGENTGAGAEAYGCVWNTQKFKDKAPVLLLKDTGESLGDFEKALGDFEKALIPDTLRTKVTREKRELEDSLVLLRKFKTFSRFPALFTFTPKHGGPHVENPENQKIHFLVFHLASSSPQYGGKEKNEAEMRVLQSLAKWAWNAGSRLILLGDHNAGECGTEETLKKFTQPDTYKFGDFAMPERAERFPATNLFPFLKGTGTSKSNVEKDKDTDIKLLKEHGGVDLSTFDPWLREYKGQRLQYQERKGKTSGAFVKSPKNLQALKILLQLNPEGELTPNHEGCLEQLRQKGMYLTQYDPWVREYTGQRMQYNKNGELNRSRFLDANLTALGNIMERLKVHTPGEDEGEPITIGRCLNRLKEKGIDLEKYDPWALEYEGEVLQYDDKNQLKNTTQNREALKNIVERKGLSDFTEYSGGKHNDNIIFPHEQRCKSEEYPIDTRSSSTFVLNLKFLEGRVLEIPIRELCAYSERNKVPLGNWKYLWSDHRPVVARFSLS